MLAAFLGLITLALVVGLAWALLISWPAMLLFGAVHTFLPIIPAFGYWQTLGIVILLRLLFGNVSVGANK